MTMLTIDMLKFRKIQIRNLMYSYIYIYILISFDNEILILLAHPNIPQWYTYILVIRPTAKHLNFAMKLLIWLLLLLLLKYVYWHGPRFQSLKHSLPDCGWAFASMFLWKLPSIFVQRIWRITLSIKTVGNHILR